MANDAAFALADAPSLGLDNSYARLPERFYARLPPTPVAAPRLLKLNHALALELGLNPSVLASPQGVEILAGNRLADDSQPIALAYAGHQFGNFVPQLGDGRAVLLGEVVDRQGRRRDLQLKGSGPTPFSRRGDGRAALGPVLREYLVSEAMFALGIPTTRSLAAVATGEHVLREEVLPGAVLTRVASSHIRVGTFQFFAARRDAEALRLLADYAIDRHYPDIERNERRFLALLERVIARQADLVARWLLVGFIHGVMNTDNTSIAGETIDYGPCAFMDAYDPAQVFSSIDHGGRYAYANQPRIAGWNLARFAETLLPLLSDDGDAAVKQAQEAREAFDGRFSGAIVSGLRAKLGLATEQEGDAALAQRLLDLMQENRADFTLTFRRLDELDALGGAFADWQAQWRRRLAEEGASPASRRAAMHAVNPAYIPRNQRVEAVLAAAIEQDDYAPFEELISVLARPYETRPEFSAYEESGPPQPGYRTFCGT
ncbi:MAG: YdiU family protein [Enhydrobacter sp.]|nr:MAG: YdiU family protein [Enhydrobacter sp.]